jgi:hypothetical protein
MALQLVEAAARRQAGRYSGRTADADRVVDQYADREGARQNWMYANASIPLQSSSPAFPAKPLQTSPAKSARRSPLLLRRPTSS